MVKMRDVFAPVKAGVNCFGYYNKKKYLVIHQTGNVAKGANAKMHAEYQINNANQAVPREASWHWQVDDEEAIRSFNHGVSCFHASDGDGDGNMHSIAIEGCINVDGDYVKTVKNMAELAAWVLKTENIPLSNMKQHYDFARDKKQCPAQIRAGKNGIFWNDFVNMVKAELDRLNGKVVVSVAGASTYKVQNGDTLSGIANKFGTTIDALVKLNGIKDKNKIIVGQVLSIEKPKTTTTTTKKVVATQPLFKAGDKVYLATKANKYSTGQTIPSSVKGKTYTVQQALSGKVLLKEIYSWVNNADVSKVTSTTTKKPLKEYIFLPSNNGTWGVYALNEAPVAKNISRWLSPGTWPPGLEYEVLSWAQPNVAVIKTDTFGRVKIYVGPDTNAKIYKK